METLILLLTVKKYIEEMEVKLDYEYGLGRALDQLIKDNAMPDVYKEVLKFLNE